MNQATNDDVAHDEKEQSDSDADIFARLRAAGIVKDLNADSSIESSPAPVAPAIDAPLSSIDREEALANALLGDTLGRLTPHCQHHQAW